ncbi:hypothetical protein MASR2M69_14930 [Bacteroidota bacterium]
MISGKYLLPGSYKIPGYVLLALGIVAAVLRFKIGIKPDFLNIKLFSAASMFFENKFFRFITNNFSEEIVILLIICGLFLIVMSKERREDEITSAARGEAMKISFFINFIFIALATLFTYGFAFIYTALFYMLFWPLIYYIGFLIICKLKRSAQPR